MSELDPDELPPLRPPARAPEALLLTVRVNGTAVESRVAGPGERLLPDVPVDVSAIRAPEEGFVVRGAGEERPVRAASPATLHAGAIDVEVGVVRRFRLPRFAWDQEDAVLPVLLAAMTLLGLQLTLLTMLFAGGGGASGFEPTPEYLARLLRGDTEGAEQGVPARVESARPRTGDPIESFYLPKGHAGPITTMGGGRNVGPRRRIGSPDAVAPAAAPDTPGPLPEELPPDAVAEAALDAGNEAAETEDEQPIAVEPNEGWGFTDWYDVQDARKEAKEIEEQLRIAREILAIDPDNPQALMIRAYYEYLAMDYAAARRTYDRFTRLYPDDPAGWNNLALTYKRTGDWKKEEELYRIAISLDPVDDHALVNLALNLGRQGRFDEAWQIMDQLEVLRPDDPYCDLHRAKIHALQGHEDRAYRFLQKSLAGMRKLDTLHNIEFRQDIRIDPAFDTMRRQERFRDLLNRYYGDDPAGWWQRLWRAPGG